MDPVTDFVGGMYTALQPNLSADLAINVFKETRRAEGGQKEAWLLGAPGRTLVAEVAGATCRGWIEQDGVALVVIDTGIYRFDESTQTLTSIGTIADNGQPCSFASNGQGGDQFAIVGGDQLKIVNRITFAVSAAVTLPFTGPVTIAFIDGYFLINQRNSPIVWFSALEDGTSWDALDFIGRSGTSDNIVAIGVAQDRVWAFGTQTTTLFYDSGDSDTPFLPYPGTATQIGLASPWAVACRNDVFTWLAIDATGTPRVVKASGVPTPNIVSTPPIERWLARCPSLALAEVLAYQAEGHAFVAFTAQTSPEDVKTYVWDDSEQQWHARAGLDTTTGRYTRWGARGVCQIGPKVFVGDATTGTVATLDLTAYTDLDGVLLRQRRMPYISGDNQWFFVDQIELGAAVGLGLTTGQGSSPVAALSISRDAAHSFISCGAGSLGAVGEWLTRAIWRRLGRVRGDRFVVDMTQSDPVPVAWTGLWMRITAGDGRL